MLAQQLRQPQQTSRKVVPQRRGGATQRIVRRNTHELRGTFYSGDSEAQ
jgi:hypothetical protein